MPDHIGFPAIFETSHFFAERSKNNIIDLMWINTCAGKAQARPSLSWAQALPLCVPKSSRLLSGIRVSPPTTTAYFVILAISACCISLLFSRFDGSGAWACDGASRRHANGVCRPVVYEGRRQRPRVHVQAKDQQQQSHGFFEILVPFLPQGEEGKKSSSLALLCKRFEQDFDWHVM